jgi:pseudouridine synthase
VRAAEPGRARRRARRRGQDAGALPLARWTLLAQRGARAHRGRTRQHRGSHRAQHRPLDRRGAHRGLRRRQADPSARPLHLLLNKPKDCLTTAHDEQGRRTVYHLLEDVREWVVPVGRLDRDTTGLLLLTNDTTLADAVTDPASHLAKTYVVKSTTRLADEQLASLARGVNLDDGPTAPAKVRRLRDGDHRTFLEITITEGRNRQVRRMLEAVGSGVLELRRTAIGPLRLEGLSLGKYRKLKADELQELRSALGAARSGAALRRNRGRSG